MATQTVEFLAVYGQTLTAKLYAVGSDTLVQTASVVAEQTNRVGVYRATFTDAPAGEYELHVATSGGNPVARWYVTLTLTTATFATYDTAVRSVNSSVTVGTNNDKTGYSLTVTPPTSAQIADAVWDEILTGATHNIQNSAGKRLRTIASQVVHTGTAQGPGTGNNQIQLDTEASATNGIYDPSVIYIESGTGAEQVRLITQYVGSTRTATVNRDWRINPASDSVFVIQAFPGFNTTNEGLARGGSATTIQLNASANTDDDCYNGQIVYITSGTGQDQVAMIEDYVGATQTATIRTRRSSGQWTVIPDSTSNYFILPALVWKISEIQSGLATSAAVTNIQTDVTTLLTRITANLFNGITYLARWLGAIAGKTADNETQTEIRATTAGVNYTITTDSLEAIRDNQTLLATAQSLSDLTQYVDTEITDIKAVTDKLNTGLVVDGGVWQFTANMLELTPTSAGGAGSGARVVTITVNDGTTTLQNATVRMAEGVNSFVTVTNSSGIAVFNLDDATYTVSISKSGYSFSGTTLTVNGVETQTYSMTQIAITPGTGNLTTGYLTALNESGSPEADVIIYVEMVKIPSNVTGYAFDSKIRSVVSAANGLVTIEGLIKGATYRIYRGDRSDNKYVIPVAAGSTYELPSIIGREQ